MEEVGGEEKRRRWGGGEEGVGGVGEEDLINFTKVFKNNFWCVWCRWR